MYFDPVYFLFLLPGLLLAAWASCKTKTTFDRYSEVTTAAGMTGAQAAARLLADAGLRDDRRGRRFPLRPLRSGEPGAAAVSVGVRFQFDRRDRGGLP